MAQIAIWTALGFLLGAMPFSFWLGRLMLRTDIRHYGDGNPGAVNAWRAGKWKVGLPALALDFLKGAMPVGLAHFQINISGCGLVAIALAPVLGHAFSPFLRFRGGKAVAVTFGIWSGLTLWEAPTILGLLLTLLIAVQSVDAWSVILGMSGLAVYLLLREVSLPLLLTWTGNFLILVWKHRSDLVQGVRLRPWAVNLLRGRQ